MKFKPLHNKILIKRLEKAEVKQGDIIIPDTAKEKPQRGKIIAVGEGKIGNDGQRHPLEVKEGDEVLFAKYAGNEIKIEDKEFLIMNEDDVLAIIQ